MRVPDSLFYHRIDIRPVLAVPQPDGTTWGSWATGVAALVVDKDELVVDTRVGAVTFGAEIASHSSILMQPESLPAIGSLIKIYPGTAHERTGTVIRVAYLEHDIVPNYGQAWLV